jgi:hypothetical protein
MPVFLTFFSSSAQTFLRQPVYSFVGRDNVRIVPRLSRRIGSISTAAFAHPDPRSKTFLSQEASADAMFAPSLGIRYLRHGGFPGSK